MGLVAVAGVTSKSWRKFVRRLSRQARGCVVLALLSASFTVFMFTIYTSLISPPPHHRSAFGAASADAASATEIPTSLGDLVTIVVKTFERPGCLQRCVESIRRYYPDIPILVVDDSFKPSNPDWLRDDPNISVHQLPYHSGAGFGRNYMVQHTRTTFLLTVDDDFIFTEDTDITVLVHASLETGADIVAANLFERNTYRGFDSMWLHNRTLYIFPNVTLFGDRWQGCVRTDFVIQFFLAKRASLQRAQWDATLKTAEHEDWMLQVQKQQLIVYTCPQVRALHSPHVYPCINSVNYNNHRLSIEPFMLKTMEKWNIDTVEQNYQTTTREGSTIHISNGDWVAIPDDKLMEVGERAVFLMNIDLPNWMKRVCVRAWAGWERSVGLYGKFRSVWVDTLFQRPKQFYRGELDSETDRFFRLVYKEEPDDVDLLFKYSHALHHHVIRSAHTVHIVMALRDNAPSLVAWLRRLRNVWALGEHAFHVTVVDFSSADIDVGAQLQESGLPHRLVTLSGPFCRSHAMNVGVRSLPGDNPIVLLLDASIMLPYGFLDRVRAYLVPGVKVFFPIYNGLYNASDVYMSTADSYWIDYGFGQAAFFRNDFLKVGGFNHTRWGCKWGGEDLDLAQHFLRAGYLLHRTYEGTLYHTPHRRSHKTANSTNTYNEPEPKVPHTVVALTGTQWGQEQAALCRHGKLGARHGSAAECARSVRVYDVQIHWRPGNAYPQKFYEVFYMQLNDFSRHSVILQSGFVPFLHETIKRNPPPSP